LRRPRLEINKHLYTILEQINLRSYIILGILRPNLKMASRVAMATSSFTRSSNRPAEGAARMATGGLGARQIASSGSSSSSRSTMSGTMSPISNPTSIPSPQVRQVHTQQIILSIGQRNRPNANSNHLLLQSRNFDPRPPHLQERVPLIYYIVSFASLSGM
jgi:hypothetical protein